MAVTVTIITPSADGADLPGADVTQAQLAADPGVRASVTVRGTVATTLGGVTPVVVAYVVDPHGRRRFGKRRNAPVGEWRFRFRRLPVGDAAIEAADKRVPYRLVVIGRDANSGAGATDTKTRWFRFALD